MLLISLYIAGQTNILDILYHITKPGKSYLSYHIKIIRANYSCIILARNNRHTRLQSDFSVPQVNAVCFGQNSIRYLGPLIWNSIPTALRNVESFVEFKSLS